MNRNSGYALVFSLAAVALLPAVALFAEPRMPTGFVVFRADSSGMSWRETGSLPTSLNDALAALKTTMKAQGYVLRHDITGGAFGDRHLFLWLKGDEEATVMIWPDGAKSTGLSWGVTNANDNTNTLRKAVANEKQD